MDQVRDGVLGGVVALLQVGEEALSPHEAFELPPALDVPVERRGGDPNFCVATRQW
ncbi:hypothetical protein GCM10009830_00370 [Glycomyces endophyticus]|uniref:Uncharacterized protein n=1 Tax=Glycomyces endophyticus TaxID=480996 RepID=A0ABP4RPI2_9ACTN